jgi:glycosyltransferase involved in cell wall biosynthesis
MYNEEEYIVQCIRSIDKQEYENIELVVVDDGSTDQSISEAKKALSDSTVRYKIIRNSTNLGQSFARNRGLMESEGQYIIFHDADDLSARSRVRKQVDYLESNSSVGVVGGAFLYINEKTGRRQVRERPSQDGEIRRNLSRQCLINLGSAMFRKEALLDTNCFSSSSSEGYEVVIQIAKDWKLSNIKDLIYVYRINEGSQSRDKELKRKAIIGYRSYQAASTLGISYWNTLLQIGWLVYIFAPKKMKVWIRKLFSPTTDRDMTDIESKEIRDLGV